MKIALGIGAYILTFIAIVGIVGFIATVSGYYDGDDWDDDYYWMD